MNNEKILAHVRMFVLREKLLCPGEPLHLAAAVSGGADSMALLRILLALQPEFGFVLSACHVNHGLRGESADRDEAFVRAECARLGVPLRVFHAAEMADEVGLPSEHAGEDWARRLRYACFARLCGEGIDVVATAHTANDQAETLLLRLARGTGLHGAAGIRPKRGCYLRPLLALTRQDTESFCRAAGQAWVTDETNATDAYARNRIRHYAVPALQTINPAAERDFHLHPGDRFNDRTVLGVSKDFRFNSCRIASSPFVFALNNDIPNPKLVSYIRFNSKTNLQEAVAHVRETLKEIDPTFPFEISFYNTILNNLYQKEQTLGKLISLFGIMAILISIVGVFGLVLFETQYRRKEIGIRKINGATTGQILLMFNKTYIRIVSVCFIISIPIAWMGTQQWLENFAYKTPLHLWVFIVAFLIILSVTIGTVTFRNWQAANENPVNSVKSE